ncbi:MAG: TIGR02117 family protein [Chromatiales bacterium]|jgi:uncharacterized protein (TIGR02117 family)|nr:TIGR02117 family protein [Chromatiales bacterium]
MFVLVLTVVAVPLAYVGIATALMVFPANREAPPPPAESSVTIYLVSNGVHVDFVLPVNHHDVTWTRQFPFSDFKDAPENAEWVAVGWGDREFYLHTRRWSDLTIARAFGAVSGSHGALLHVTYLKGAWLRSPLWKVQLSPGQYQRLAAYVRDTASLDHNGVAVAAAAGYGRIDAFFEAAGQYSPLNTCNAWVGQGLREAGVTVSRWTPFDWNVTGFMSPGIAP